MIDEISLIISRGTKLIEGIVIRLMIHLFLRFKKDLFPITFIS